VCCRICVTNGFLWDCGPSSLQVIDQVLPCSSGLIPHLPHDHWCPTRWDIAWNPRTRVIDRHLELLPFCNNCTNNCCLLTKLLAYCPVAHPSLVQVYNCIPDVLTPSLVLALVERLESLWLSVWTGVFYTGNEFKQVQLIQVMSGEQEGFLKKN
jgi:hypothetical protein